MQIRREGSLSRELAAYLQMLFTSSLSGDLSFRWTALFCIGRGRSRWLSRTCSLFWSGNSKFIWFWLSLFPHWWGNPTRQTWQDLVTSQWFSSFPSMLQWYAFRHQLVRSRWQHLQEEHYRQVSHQLLNK